MFANPAWTVDVTRVLSRRELVTVLADARAQAKGAMRTALVGRGHPDRSGRMAGRTVAPRRLRWRSVCVQRVIAPARPADSAGGDSARGFYRRARFPGRHGSGR